MSSLLQDHHVQISVQIADIGCMAQLQNQTQTTAFDGLTPVSAELSPSKLTGVQFEQDVVHSPEVEAAFEEIHEVIRYPDVQMAGDIDSFFGSDIEVSDQAMERLRNYFEANPSEFGDQFMAALESGDGEQIDRTLRENGLMAVNINGALHGVHKIETIYHMDPNHLAQIYGPDVPQDQRVYGLSGDTYVERVRGFANVQGVGGGELEQVIFENNIFDDDRKSAVIADEAQHGIQVKRYGEEVFDRGSAQQLAETIGWGAFAISGEDPSQLSYHGAGDILGMKFTRETDPAHQLAQHYADTIDVIDEVVASHLDPPGPEMGETDEAYRDRLGELRDSEAFRKDMRDALLQAGVEARLELDKRFGN